MWDGEILCLQRETTWVPAAGPLPASRDVLKSSDRTSRANPALGGGFWCGHRADGAALLCLACTEPDPASSRGGFVLQQLGAGQRRVSAPVAWMYAGTFLTLLSSGPADAVPVVARAVLVEGRGLQVSVGPYEVSNKEWSQMRTQLSPLRRS